jgi:hypothetical protein
MASDSIPVPRPGRWRHPLKVETRVRTPLGLRRSEAISWGYEGKWPRIGPAAYTCRHDGLHGFPLGSCGIVRAPTRTRTATPAIVRLMIL